MEFSFFITDNKSGYKTNQKWLEKNHPSELIKILDYCKTILPITSSIKEKIWVYYHKLEGRPKCPTCNNETTFSGRFDRGYNDFCSINCINSNKEEMKKRVSLGIKSKYGVNFYPEHKDFIKKQKNTKLKKYGNENYNNVEKSKKTSIERYGVDSYNKSQKFKDKKFEKFKILYPTFNLLKNNKDEVTFFCGECNLPQTIHKQTFYYRIRYNMGVCPNCNKIGVCHISTQENEIVSFINSLGVRTIQSYKYLNDKKEIDIFLPDFNIGFEHNGVYWHNEYFSGKNGLIDKTKECKSLGIELFHIFEDEWINKRPIVESIIRNKVNMIRSTIYGRQCTIQEISSKDCGKFLEKNHIQGKVNSKVKLGLYFRDELVSVMTFGSYRKIMGRRKKDNEWEMLRFCNKLNTNIVGGASKLLSYFILFYKPIKIISYSDIRLFNGKLYEKLNFKKNSESTPNYWYVINRIRHHRFLFRKSILVKNGFDKSKSEHQIMIDRKIYRIYDCGNIMWEMSL